jgi:hypothetical protein
MAARVAAQVKQETGVNVETIKGGLGEFSVHIDGRKVVDTNRLWYPTPGKIVMQIVALLEE